MHFLFEVLISVIVDFIVAIWRVDDRPQARQFTVGCLIIGLLVFGLIALVMWLW
ncbi:MAG: hypothetical protein HC898_10420 [Phycisphaerales bacterium]|nr:hypothetical protein [Phycisphaerales bacterium]